MSCSPQTIVYSKALPVVDDCQGSCTGKNSFYNLPIDPNSRIVEVKSSDPQINISDLSDLTKWKFNIDFLPHKPLTAIASITPFVSDVQKPNPALLGETIDQIDLAWTPSATVTTQALSSDDVGISHPTINAAARTNSYTGLSITEDTEFYLDIDDGKSLDGSTLKVTFKMLFGNYFYYGNAVNKLSTAASGMQAMLDGFTKEIDIDRTKSLNASGQANKHFFFAYPKRFGLPTDVVKDGLSGGYLRLKNVSGTLKSVLVDGDTETDISISNGLTSEAYYIFMSQFDNQEDNNLPIVIS